MTRPSRLPDFANPPLDEVVLGVQFAPVPAYTAVNARDVRELFRAGFPKVQEQPLLMPQFETFGGANLQASFPFQIGGPPAGSRLWFLSNDENHLLQFQPDRFLSNWRKRPIPQPYPRFESIAEAFENNLNTLAKHFASELDYPININQAEVAYINIIPVEDFSNAGKWFRLWNGVVLNIEVLHTSFNEVIRDKNGNSHARLSHTIQCAFAPDGKHKAFQLSLTFRGKPSGTDVPSAMQFLTQGREAIVMRFKEITTSEAHNFWGIKE
ncbi:MAG: TIGR04255 family protein [Defluviicoccus sp.]